LLPNTEFHTNTKERKKKYSYGFGQQNIKHISYLLIRTSLQVPFKHILVSLTTINSIDMVSCWLDLLGSEKGPLTDSYEEANGTSDYTKGGQFPNQKSNCQFTNKDPSP
jgi:hypothetical protein